MGMAIDDKLLTPITDTRTAVRRQEKYFLPTLRKIPNEALLLIAWMLHRKSGNDGGLIFRSYLVKENCQGEDRSIVTDWRPLLTNLF